VLRLVGQREADAAPRSEALALTISAKDLAGAKSEVYAALLKATKFSNKAAEAVPKPLLDGAVRPHDNRDKATVFAGFVEHVLT